MECNGECKKHGKCKGKVRAVLVSGNGFVEPFSFKYCETAVKVDKENGFKVKYVSG